MINLTDTELYLLMFFIMGCSIGTSVYCICCKKTIVYNIPKHCRVKKNRYVFCFYIFNILFRHDHLQHSHYIEYFLAYLYQLVQVSLVVLHQDIPSTYPIFSIIF